jgi:hypothetical protein
MPSKLLHIRKLVIQQAIISSRREHDGCIMYFTVVEACMHGDIELTSNFTNIIGMCNAGGNITG